ncbi:MAG: hypothetical protein HQL74_12650 [Magnetococcales bacterium]|nr:hypothetical protein [Magnetococcales bacterium]
MKNWIFLIISPLGQWVAQPNRTPTGNSSVAPPDSVPHYLIHDRDPVIPGRGQETLKAMEIKEVKIVPASSGKLPDLTPISDCQRTHPKGDVPMTLARFRKIWAIVTAGTPILLLIFAEIRFSVQRNPTALSPKGLAMGPKLGRMRFLVGTGKDRCQA